MYARRGSVAGSVSLPPIEGKDHETGTVGEDQRRRSVRFANRRGSIAGNMSDANVRVTRSDIYTHAHAHTHAPEREREMEREEDILMTIYELLLLFSKSNYCFISLYQFFVVFRILDTIITTIVVDLRHRKQSAI